MDRPRNLRGHKQGSYTQADRFARIIRTLASRAVTINELADKFGITRRQVYRDLAEIEKEGHPIEQSDGSGEKTWQLPLGYKGLPQIAITQYELMSLYLAKNHLAYLNGTPFVDDLESVIAKVEAGLPAKVINHLERISSVFVPVRGPKRSYAKQKDIVSGLRRALLLQRTVILHHQKPDYDVPPRIVWTPMCLCSISMVCMSSDTPIAPRRSACFRLSAFIESI